jgi:hypothetical protein
LTHADERAALSATAVLRAIDGYLNEVHHTSKPPVPAADAVAARAALAGESPWRAEYFERLVTLSLVLYRLARVFPGMPDSNVGDALEAITSLRTMDANARSAAVWPFDPRISADARAKLGFRTSSEGIAKVQSHNRDGWRAHALKNRGFIEAAARKLRRRELAVVMGAGYAFDLPLVELSRSFARLVLVDVDEPSLSATVRAVFKEPRLRARVEPRILDLTGVNEALVRALDQIFATGDGRSSSRDEILLRLADLARSYRVAPAPSWATFLTDGERPDLVVSSCVLSQIARPQRVYAQRLFEERFGKLRDEAERHFILPWREFELRVQHDHIKWLADLAEVAVLTSDMVHVATAFDATGVERPTGNRVFLMAVESLRERVPTFLRIAAHESWVWNRFRPGRNGEEGSRMEVCGIVLGDS